MKLSYSILAITILSIISLSGCGGETPANNTPASSNNGSVANVQKPAANDPTAVTTPTPDQVTNSAPTLTPVYKAFCAAVVKKDDAAIRKFYTSDTLKAFDEDMRSENIKTMTEYLKDEKISNETCEISNERLKGDKAVARIRTPAYPNGYEVLFVKEGGEWKMSSISPEKGFN
ncbi:MAG: hypothetical protein AB7Q37_16015 [Pyrinomonadaceae bacterium]